MEKVSAPRLVGPSGDADSAAVSDDSPQIPLPPAGLATEEGPELAAKEASPADAPSAKDSSEKLTDAAQRVMSAYGRTETAATIDEFTSIIADCRTSRAAKMSPEMDTYARQLASWALNRRGELLAEQGDQARALADFQEAIGFKADNWRAIHNRGIHIAQSGDREKALADFNRTIELNPKHLNAWFNRGELHYEAGEYEKALDDYNEALKISPHDPLVRNSRGHTYHQLQDFRRAAIDFTVAIKFDQTNAGAMTNRGDVYAELGFYQHALRDYMRAIETDPKLARAYQGAAWLMATCPDERFRNAEGGVEAAVTAIKLNGGNDPADFDTLAAALANAGRFEQAQKAASKAIALAPGEQAKPYEARLALYTQKQPFRAAHSKIDSAITSQANPSEIEQSSYEAPPTPEIRR